MVPHNFPHRARHRLRRFRQDIGSGVRRVSARRTQSLRDRAPPIERRSTTAPRPEHIMVPEGPASASARRRASTSRQQRRGPSPRFAQMLGVEDTLDLSHSNRSLDHRERGSVRSITYSSPVAACTTVLTRIRPRTAPEPGLGVSKTPARRQHRRRGSAAPHCGSGRHQCIDLVNYAPGTYDAALKHGGRVASSTNAAGDGPGRTNVMSAPSPELLGRIAKHLAEGTVSVPIRAQYPLAQALEALQALASGRTRGKIAVEVAGE